jgi:CheY-like chemotaxis protein
MAEPRSRRRIVVADDTKFWREKISMVLAPTGHEILAVDDGVPAIRLCMDPMRPVDLLIVDLVMPGVDGFQVARYLRSQRLTGNLPIVAVTSLFKVEDFPDGPRTQGFDAILDKASSPDQFLFVFNKYLNQHRKTRRPAPRVPSSIPATFRCEDGRVGQCVISNISSSGAFLSLSAPLSEGSEISLAFTIPSGPSLRVLALVIWVNDREVAAKTNYSRGMGVLFRGLSAAWHKALSQHVKAELAKL